MRESEKDRKREREKGENEKSEREKGFKFSKNCTIIPRIIKRLERKI